jgi:hypothetical protein
MIKVSKCTKETKAQKAPGTIDEANSINTIGNRVTIKTDSGTISRPNIPLTEITPDNNAFFEERSNPLSSKGN